MTRTLSGTSRAFGRVHACPYGLTLTQRVKPRPCSRSARASHPPLPASASESSS
jgi:hypothetical protein